MAIGAAIGVVAGVGTNILAQYVSNGYSFENFNLFDTIIAGAIGGVSGALGMTGAGRLIQGSANALLSGIGTLLQGGSFGNFLSSAGLGFVAGVLGGPGYGFGGLHFTGSQRLAELLPPFLAGLGRSTVISNIPTGVKAYSNSKGNEPKMAVA